MIVETRSFIFYLFSFARFSGRDASTVWANYCCPVKAKPQHRELRYIFRWRSRFRRRCVCLSSLIKFSNDYQYGHQPRLVREFRFGKMSLFIFVAKHRFTIKIEELSFRLAVLLTIWPLHGRVICHFSSSLQEVLGSMVFHLAFWTISDL